MKHFISLFIVIVPLSLFAQTVGSLVSDRPGQAMATSALQKQIVQVQSGYNLNKISANDINTTSSTSNTVLRVAILNGFEVNGTMNWNQTRTNFAGSDTTVQGLTDLHAGGRVTLLRGEGFKPSVALQGSAVFTRPASSLSSGKYSANGAVFTVSAGNSLTDKIGLTTNLGLRVSDSRAPTTWFYVLNASYSLTETSATFVEIYGNFSDGSINFDTGYSILLLDDFQFDFGAGWQGQEGVTDWFLDCGFSWRFPWGT